VHLFLNNNKALDFLPINSIKNGGITNEVLKLKDEYITGAEASMLLGMRHSYITNLQKQRLIKPYYMGKNDKNIRLFKREDVQKLKDSNYFKT
ncbi:hypothetical protein M0O54_08365, partial [Acinetobacter lactucae]|nr:hypothetical protein [Acinetobacter lactucae]